MLSRLNQTLPRLTSENRHRIGAILAIAIPAGLNSLLDILTVAIDLLMVGVISPEATVAVGVGLNYFLLIYVFTTIFFVGTNALVSRFFGAKELKSACEALSSIALVALLAGIPLFGAAYLSYERFFDFIGVSEEAKRLGVEYLSILIFMTLLFTFRVVMTSALSAIGDTKTPFLIKLASAVLNVALNYLFIFGKAGFPAMGVAGAALSTLLVTALEVAVLIYVLSGARRAIGWVRAFEWSYVARALRVGFPSGAERLFTILAIIIIAKLVAGYGTSELAGYQIASRIEGFVFMPGFGFMVAAMALMGQNLGAKNPAEAERYVYTTLWLGASFMGFLGFLMVIFSEPLSALFTSERETILYSALYLFIVGLSQIPLALIFIFDGALRGAGATKATLWVNSLSIWIGRILPSIWIAQEGWALGWIYGLIALETLARAGIFWWLFKRGIWRDREV